MFTGAAMTDARQMSVYDGQDRRGMVISTRAAAMRSTFTASISALSKRSRPLRLRSPCRLLGPA
jgi:hypothetical protein